MVFDGAHLKSIIIGLCLKWHLPPHLTQALLMLLREPQDDTADTVESDIEYTASSQTAVMDTLHPNIIKQFEKMLQKALKQTSKHITDSLTKEIRELGQHTSDLKNRVEDETNVQSHVCELENLKEENLTLQMRLEDFENRACHSNLRIHGIPEPIVDLQSTITALLQELMASIPIDQLEFDRIHRALKPRKTEGPPRDIIAKLHFFSPQRANFGWSKRKRLPQFSGSPLPAIRRSFPNYSR